MRFLATTTLLAAATLLLQQVDAAQNTCTISSISSCSKAIKLTKTRSIYLTSWCSSVLGCTKSTKTITGDTVTTTSTKSVWETYTEEYIDSETYTTTTFDYTETSYTEVATETFKPTWTVEKFVITTTNPPRVRDIEDKMHARDFFDKRDRTTSICPPANEKKACTCLMGGCAPPVTKDLRKTKVIRTTETFYSRLEVPITYTNTEWEPIYHTETVSLTWIQTSGYISTHTTTIKCTPSATSATNFFKLQATNAPDVNGKYVWVAPTSPRLLSFSVEPTFTSSELDATVFSLDSEGRMITRHYNGTLYANVDHYTNFPLLHFIERREIQRRSYEYLRCSIKPASGKYRGGYRELYCLADGAWQRDVFNYCPLYKEWFNSPVVLGDFYSETSPDCFAIVYLVKPVCKW